MPSLNNCVIFVLSMNSMRRPTLGQTSLEYLLLLAVVAVIIIAGLGPNTAGHPSLLGRIHDSAQDYYSTVTRVIMGENPRKTIDGNWCPVTCPKGAGPAVIYRSCECPAPAFGGKNCEDVTNPNYGNCGPNQTCNGAEVDCSGAGSVPCGNCPSGQICVPVSPSNPTGCACANSSYCSSIPNSSPDLSCTKCDCNSGTFWNPIKKTCDYCQSQNGNCTTSTDGVSCSVVGCTQGKICNTKTNQCQCDLCSTFDTTQNQCVNIGTTICNPALNWWCDPSQPPGTLCQCNSGSVPNPNGSGCIVCPGGNCTAKCDLCSTFDTTQNQCVNIGTTICNPALNWWCDPSQPPGTLCQCNSGFIPNPNGSGCIVCPGGNCSASCPLACQTMNGSGVCLPTTSCGSNNCGQDSCGGICGPCSGGNCSNTSGGPGTCTCPTGEALDSTGTCVPCAALGMETTASGTCCTPGPSCAGSNCGQDSCGVSCGICPPVGGTPDMTQCSNNNIANTPGHCQVPQCTDNTGCVPTSECEGVFGILPCGKCTAPSPNYCPPAGNPAANTCDACSMKCTNGPCTLMPNDLCGSRGVDKSGVSCPVCPSVPCPAGQTCLLDSNGLYSCKCVPDGATCNPIDGFCNGVGTDNCGNYCFTAPLTCNTAVDIQAGAVTCSNGRCLKCVPDPSICTPLDGYCNGDGLDNCGDFCFTAPQTCNTPNDISDGSIYCQGGDCVACNCTIPGQTCVGGQCQCQTGTCLNASGTACLAPDCSGVGCGQPDRNCGQPCQAGTCPVSGEVCNAGQCQCPLGQCLRNNQCLPQNCSGLACGQADLNCGLPCATGSCPLAGQICDPTLKQCACPAGECVLGNQCVAQNCSGMGCGQPDLNCGQPCPTGSCAVTGATCNAGQCQCPAGDCVKNNQCLGQNCSGVGCGQPDLNCGQPCPTGSCGITGSSCVAGQCQCPGGTCLIGNQCAAESCANVGCGQPDNCGNPCMSGSCPVQGQTCVSGACVCPAGTCLQNGQCAPATCSGQKCGQLDSCGQNTCTGGGCQTTFTLQSMDYLNCDSCKGDCGSFGLDPAKCGTETDCAGQPGCVLNPGAGCNVDFTDGARTCGTCVVQTLVPGSGLTCPNGIDTTLSSGTTTTVTNITPGSCGPSPTPSTATITYTVTCK